MSATGAAAEMQPNCHVKTKTPMSQAILVKFSAENSLKAQALNPEIKV